MSRVVLDYGHGGLVGGRYQTAGKRYTHTDVSPPLMILEGVVQRQIVAREIALWLAAGVEVYDCVAGRRWERAPSWQELEQQDVALSARTAYANGIPSSVLISHHSNAVGNALSGPSQSARGIEIYTSRGQTRADALADSLLAAFRRHLEPLGMPVRRGDWGDGDGDMEADFWMLSKSKSPAVLGEVGFHTNLSDARILLSEAGQQAIATAYYVGARAVL